MRDEKVKPEAEPEVEEEYVTCLVCGADIKETEAYDRYPNVPLCGETCHMNWILEF